MFAEGWPYKGKGNQDAAVVVAAAGGLGVLGGAVQITIHIRR
ncbi:hypothetical protein ACWDG1_30390 [Streptomyces sp. NPDC001177]